MLIAAEFGRAELLHHLVNSYNCDTQALVSSVACRVLLWLYNRYTV